MSYLLSLCFFMGLIIAVLSLIYKIYLLYLGNNFPQISNIFLVHYVKIWYIIDISGKTSDFCYIGGGSRMKYTNTPELLKMIKVKMINDDIKIKDLAVSMGKSQSAASSIMRQTNISLDSLKEICDALNYDLDINIKKRQ